MWTKADWKLIATECAKRAFRKRRRIARGVLYCEDVDVLVVVNSAPYPLQPDLREWELKKLREWLHEVGIEELGIEHYPVFGPKAGCTYAMVINASWDRHDRVAETLELILAAARRRQDGFG